jgi:hypothetical protein
MAASLAPSVVGREGDDAAVSFDYAEDEAKMSMTVIEAASTQ